LIEDKFTLESDIWFYSQVKIVSYISRSFGVTMWEIFSDGATPYAGVNDVIEYLQKENRLIQPESCDSEIYRVMQLCWNSNPKQRYPFLSKN
jgi:hypothetical protein